MIIFSSRLLKKSSNQKSKLVQSLQVCTWLSNTGTGILFAANFICDSFRIIQTLFSQAGCWFRPAALHRIQLWTCCFVPMPGSMPYLTFELGQFCKSGIAWLSNTTFHLCSVWLQTLDTMDSESYQTLFPSFCSMPSEVAMLFHSNLSRH